ncbi:CerR family C-terminal domain-containing protein [Tropicimonas sp. IMCC34043]|uniref:CerR family C-terminal domain-containing protein n=1 Tax=Tropicimonas sp. IMCC34043 TaxID=2248760 RepID=UPI0018E520F6|nr:CerR family C-terminal domain-containing protein [Tropicimonas sp. IMCC34043]
MTTPPETSKPDRPAYDRLLETAVEQFGLKGVDGISTRELARAAGTVMSSITYHYGSKQGLYLAAADYATDRIAEFLGPLLVKATPPDQLDPAEAVDEICRIAEVALRFMLAPEGASLARFVVREQMEPTEAFEIIYGKLISRLTARLVGLVERAGNGRWGPEEVRIKSVTIFGQLLVFRVARATVMAVTGWETLTPDHGERVRSVVQGQIRAILAPMESAQ